MSTQTVTDLIAEDTTANMGLGEDSAGPDLYAGYIPERTVEYMPQLQLGDGLAGPPNQQQLVIYRESRPIATDELGMQGPFSFPQAAIARHRAGRTVPLNYEFGPAGLDPGNVERAPTMDGLVPTPLSPDQLPDWHAGVMAPEILPPTYTVPYTFSPDVGYGQP